LLIAAWLAVITLYLAHGYLELLADLLLSVKKFSRVCLLLTDHQRGKLCGKAAYSSHFNRLNIFVKELLSPEAFKSVLRFP
jgi:hypothetical protein